MQAGGSGDDKPYVDPERPDPGIGRRASGESGSSQAAAIADLPSNATQPGGAPKSTEEPGNSDADAPKPSDRLPPAGPHADPALMNPDATPGAGALTPPGKHGDTDSTSS